jgi:hypothetical protein
MVFDYFPPSPPEAGKPPFLKGSRRQSPFSKEEEVGVAAAG